MLLNKYGSRSFNDMSQYPFFPWLITDYKMDIHSFKQGQESNTVCRNLGKTTVIFNEADKQKIDMKYEDRLECYVDRDGLSKDDNYMLNQPNWKMTGKEPFQVQSGYSSLLTNMQMLQRFEPYTSAFMSQYGSKETAEKQQRSSREAAEERHRRIKHVQTQCKFI